MGFSPLKPYAKLSENRLSGCATDGIKRFISRPINAVHRRFGIKGFTKDADLPCPYLTNLHKEEPVL